MNLSISIDNVGKLKNGIWVSKLNPSEVRIFGNCPSNYGDFSILLIESDIGYNSDNQTISFNPNAARLINVGSTDQLLILQSHPGAAEKEKKSDSQNMGRMPVQAKGDHHFISNLPDDLNTLGTKFFAEVRKQFKGELKYHAISKKYVESPDNFWVVRIQPSDKSLRITVRGRPGTFPKIHGIELKPDMTGYSAFKIWRENQIDGAIAIIRQASVN